MIKIRQQGKEKILLIDFNFLSGKKIFKIIESISNSLDILTQHHTSLGLTMALGLGLGIGLTIFLVIGAGTSRSSRVKEVKTSSKVVAPKPVTIRLV